jgi:hypothetical protein
MPKVLNLKDTNYKVPHNAIYVGRAMPRYNLPASRWANPFKTGKDGTREEVIEMYRKMITDPINDVYDLTELKGHDLICWCSPLPCHADVLLELANK